MIPLQLRLIAAGVALCAIGVLAVVVNGWRLDAAKVPALERQIEDSARSLKRAEEASIEFHKELADIRATRPAPVIRLCVNPVQTGPDPASGPDGPAGPAGVLPPAVGRDIGPELYGLADRADECSARLRALQRLAAGSSSP